MENEENETCDAGFKKKKFFNKSVAKKETDRDSSESETRMAGNGDHTTSFFSSQVADASKLGRAHWAQTIILKPNFIFSTRVLCMFAYDLPPGCMIFRTLMSVCSFRLE